MPEKKMRTSIYKIIFSCPECKIGQLICIEGDRLIYTFGSAPPIQKSIAHRCQTCGFITGLNKPYPYVQIDEIAGLEIIDSKKENE